MTALKELRLYEKISQIVLKQFQLSHTFLVVTLLVKAYSLFSYGLSKIRIDCSGHMCHGFLYLFHGRSDIRN